MHETNPANSPEQTGLPLTSGNEAGIGPGLGSLLQGNKHGPTPVSPDSRGEAAGSDFTVRQPRSLQWTLVAADALLVLLAFWLVVGKTKALSIWEILLCVVTLSLASCLGCWAFLLGRKR